MTTNDKTLADVQPGGRVRLGDKAERARFEAWAEERELGTAKCSADGMKGDYAELNTDWCWAAWRAALSAQPSQPSSFDLEAMLAACVPGGSIVDPQVIADNIRHWFSAQPSPGSQDTVVSDDMVQAFKAALARAQLPGRNRTYFLKDSELPSILREVLTARQPVYVQGCDELRARTEGERAAYTEGLEEGKKIAARQPVGEPVAYTSPTQLREMVNRGDGFMWHRPGSTDIALYAVPPAQVVDLDALLRLSDGWLARSEKLSVTQQRKAGAYWACAKELRDWLDSQAVGK